MNNFKIIGFTHKNIDLDDIGKLHIEDDQLKERLLFLKQQVPLRELMYLSTCNRVEFLIFTSQLIDKDFLHTFFECFNPKWSKEELAWATKAAKVIEGKEALKHLLNVSSSIDSLVVGEREIITQVRKAYDDCLKINLCGNMIRLVIGHAIETAKKVYTETRIAQEPVSIVSLAYRELKKRQVNLDAKFLIIGAGATNITMAKYLKKHGFSNFKIFNRTYSNAEKLALELKGKAFGLADLNNYADGFDVIITCTASSGHMITKEIYSQLVRGDKSKKIIIDLAIPNDFDSALLKTNDIHLIAINNLQTVAKENLKKRQKELDACEKIVEERLQEFMDLLKIRQLEMAMSEIPRKVKEIREAALNGIFAKDIEGMDDSSKEIMNRVLAYVEKKYISVPMKMAREILIEHK